MTFISKARDVALTIGILGVMASGLKATGILEPWLPPAVITWGPFALIATFVGFEFVLGIIAKTRATVVQAANTEIYRRRYRRLGLTRQEISDYENAGTQAAACGVTPEQIHEMSAAVARGKRFTIDPINTPPEGTQ